MKNKKLIVVISLLLIACFCLVLAACKDDPQVTQLAAPQISLENSTGTVSWNDVEHADSYDVIINDGAAISVTTTSYTFPAEAEEGVYNVTVIAKSSKPEYSASEVSNKVVYTVIVTMETTLELDVQKVKTVYYLDEGATNVDYTGLVINARYTNNSTKTLSLSAVQVDDSEVDLSKKGNHRIKVTYQEDGITATAYLYVAVRERTIEDVKYTEMMVERNTSGNYDLGECVSARMMDGTSVLNGDGTARLPVGKTLIRLDDKYVLVTVATSIASVEQFKAIADDMNGYYVLAKDIDFENKWQSPLGAIPLDTNKNGELVVSSAGGSDTAQKGTAFNGVFDGQGYTLKNYKFGCDDAWRKVSSRGLSLFAWLGKNGEIKNVNIRNASVRGAGFCSFLVGYNQGTVTNVCVESSCVMYNHYSSQLSGAVVAYNDGEVNNAVSYVENYTCRKGNDGTQVLPYYVVNPGTSEYKQGSGTTSNTYVCDTTDLSALLGSDWLYFEGLGTVLANDDYVFAATTQRELSVGDKMYLNIVYRDLEKVNVSVYGDENNEKVSIVWDSDKKSHYITLAQDSSLVVGDTITVRVYSAGWKSSHVFQVEITSPRVVEYQAPTDLTVVEGIDLELTDVKIRQIYSDGSNKIVNPIKIEGFNKNGTVGAEQTVKAFYGEGNNDYVTVSVVLQAKSVESITVSTQSQYKSEYETDETLDINGLKIDVMYNNNTCETIDVVKSMINASSYDMSIAGNQSVEINYFGKTCSFSITVREKGVVITSVEISGTPAKTQYAVGDTVTLDDLAGVKLIANSDGGQAEVEITLAMISYDFSSAGDKQITVTYAEKTATINVTVIDYIVEFVVTPNDSENAIPQIFYDIASTPDVLSSATYSVRYKSGKTETVAQDNVTAGTAVSGKVTVTFTYVCADGTFTAEKEYAIWAEIDSASDWAKINENLAGYYILTGNLTFGGETYTSTKSPYDLPHKNDKYCMIGEPSIYKWPGNSASCDPTIMQDDARYTDVAAEASPFTGIFDGNGYYIHSLKIDGGSNSSNRGGMGLALFGAIGEGATVRNFTLRNVTVNAQSASALVAVVNFGTVENIVIEDSCSVTNKGNNETAAVICYNAAGATARNIVCYATTMGKTQSGNVTAFAAKCFVVNKSGATAENCCVKGTAAFDALTAEELGEGWTVLDGFGPVYGNYAVVTSYQTSAENGTFTFKYAFAKGINQTVYCDARIPKTTSGTATVEQSIALQNGIATVTLKDTAEAPFTVGETYVFRIRLGGSSFGLYSINVTITE